MRILFLLVATALLLCGCDGRANLGDSPPASGLPAEKRLGELSGAELLHVCEWSLEARGGAGASHACGTSTVEIGSVVECLQQFTTAADHGCSLTVAELEACVRAMAADPCQPITSIAACVTVTRCGVAGRDDPDDGPSHNTSVPRADGGVMSADGAPSNGAWDCGSASGGANGAGCVFEWYCPGQGDRRLDCPLQGDGVTMACTCKNLREGTVEGSFTSTDICDIGGHNVAYRANKACGWSLPTSM